MRVSIDHGRCQGHGQCVLTAPDLFGFDEQGMGVVLIGDGPVPPDRVEAVEKAVLRCPERALSVTNPEDG